MGQRDVAYNKAKECIQRGVALLDQKAPLWREHEFADLEMSSPCGCILGCVFDSYGDGMDYLFGKYLDCDTRERYAQEHGFEIDGYGYDLLQQLWEEELARGKKV